MGWTEAELSLTLVSDRAMARLNRAAFGRRGPTNVIAFPVDVASGGGGHGSETPAPSPKPPPEFGRKVWLDEVEGGIISDYRILPGNLPDDQPFK